MMNRYLWILAIAIALVGTTQTQAADLAAGLKIKPVEKIRFAPEISDDERGVYLGLGFGESRSRTDNNFQSPTARDSAFKLFAGYEFNRYVATELSYLNITADADQ